MRGVSEVQEGGSVCVVYTVVCSLWYVPSSRGTFGGQLVILSSGSCFLSVVLCVGKDRHCTEPFTTGVHAHSPPRGRKEEYTYPTQIKILISIGGHRNMTMLILNTVTHIISNSIPWHGGS